MKTKDDILKRLKKLRIRYANKYVAKSQLRVHTNCIHNMKLSPPKNKYKSEQIDSSISPRKQVTLVIIQTDEPIGMCMHNSHDANKWAGNICDSDDVSDSCGLFSPKMSIDTAKNSFLESLQDDEYVFDNYRDMATLQWVIGERIYSYELSWLERIFLWFKHKLIRINKPILRLPNPKLPEDLWGNDDSS